MRKPLRHPTRMKREIGISGASHWILDPLLNLELHIIAADFCSLSGQVGQHGLCALGR